MISAITVFFMYFYMQVSRREIPVISSIQVGKTLYYDSNTNKHYYDSDFTQAPQKVSDILNKAFLDNKGKNVDILVPAGDYLLDKPLVLQNGARLVGVSGKTRFIIDDTFDRNYNDYIITNAPDAQVSISNIYVEYKGYKTPAFSDTAQNPNGIEGIMLKISKTTKATITNSGFVAKYNGIKTKITPIWFRDGYSNVDIHDCYIENTSGSDTAGGCIWFMNNNGNIGDTVNVYNNTIVKNSHDEAIAVWGYNGSHLNYSIYNNTINYAKGVTNTVCDSLIAVWSQDDGSGLYKNIKFSNNIINLTGISRRVFVVNIMKAKFENVVIENNNITESVGDSTSNTLLPAFEVLSSTLPTELTAESTYLRGDVSINNNSFTNTSPYGRRCFAAVTSALLKLNGNKVNSNFGYSVIWEEDGNAKIMSTGNDYNYSGTGKANFAFIKGANTKAYFNSDKIALGETSTNRSNLSFTNCTFR